MKIKDIIVRKEELGLTRPYTIAFKTTDSVSVSYVEIIGENGMYGLGSSNPSPYVIGETLDETMATLEAESFDWLIGRDIREVQQLLFEVNAKHPTQPAVRAALDIALYDLFAKYLDVPLVKFLGQKLYELPTSITIGIKNVEETLEEAQEYVERGFTNLKVKLGISLEEDIERVTKIYERYGARIIQRVDANQGYSVEQVLEFYKRTASLDLELVEQPMEAGNIEPLRHLSEPVKRLIAADESLISPEDGFKLASPPAACGIFNIKLMKCGGVSKALEIATIAKNSGQDLMWGCNDESIISITAALHAAFASEKTRYIDLDGSLDLARDLVKGGFTITDGVMRLTDAPGLGVEKV